MRNGMERGEMAGVWKAFMERILGVVIRTWGSV